jgi:hypothetical protein
MWRLPAISILSLLALAVGRPAPADDLGAGIAALLNSSGKSTPASLDACRARFEQLQRARPDDRRIDYAYGLALVNQHRFREALPLLSKYIKASGDDLSAQCVKMWAETQDRRYSQSLASAVELSQTIAKGLAPGAELQASARFLGTVFGYFELARPGVVDGKLRTRSRSQVVAALGETYISFFDEGRGTVAQRLSDLKAQRTSQLEQHATAAGRRRAEVESLVTTNNAQLTKNEDSMQTSLEQVTEAQRELSGLQSQLANLQKDRTLVSAQVIAAETQYSQLMQNAPIGWRTAPLAIQLVAVRSVDGRARLLALTDALSALYKQGFNMDRTILSLQSRANLLIVEGQQQSDTFAESEENAAHAQKRAKTLEKAVSRRAAAAPSGRASALALKMATFSTYAPSPFEKEKERVLNWFGK